MPPLVYHYDPTPVTPKHEAGVTQGWIVLWSGKPGPAVVAPAAMLIDDEGVVNVVQTGEAYDTEVVDDLSDGGARP